MPPKKKQKDVDWKPHCASKLEIAEFLESEEDFPNIHYHNRCRRVYI